MHKKFHWLCCLLPIVTSIFWAVAIFSTGLAWISVRVNDLVLSYGAQWWVINALIFGLLALYGGGGKHNSCGSKGHHSED